MDSIEFANKYRYEQFKIPHYLLFGEYGQPGIKQSDRVLSHLVGYINGDSERVVLEIEDEIYRSYGWPLHSGVTLTAKVGNLYNEDNPILFAIRYKRLPIPKTRKELIEESKQARTMFLAEIRGNHKSTDHQTKIKSKLAYPHICKTCRAPAKNYGARTMCSNSVCNTRYDVLKSIDFKYDKTEPRRRLLYCPVEYCKKPALFVYPQSVYMAIPEGLASGLKQGINYRISCENGHNFYLSKETLKKNDCVISQSPEFKNSLSKEEKNSFSCMWNGEKWEQY